MTRIRFSLGARLVPATVLLPKYRLATPAIVLLPDYASRDTRRRSPPRQGISSWTNTDPMARARATSGITRNIYPLVTRITRILSLDASRVPAIVLLSDYGARGQLHGSISSPWWKAVAAVRAAGRP